MLLGSHDRKILIYLQSDFRVRNGPANIYAARRSRILQKIRFRQRCNCTRADAGVMPSAATPGWVLSEFSPGTSLSRTASKSSPRPFFSASSEAAPIWRSHSAASSLRSSSSSGGTVVAGKSNSSIGVLLFFRSLRDGGKLAQ